MNQKTIERLENLFIQEHDVRRIASESCAIVGADTDKSDYAYHAYFTHPQILPNEMLYIGHFLDLPFCLDLGCPGAVHVLTGNRTGMVDEWDWFKSFGEALKAALAMSDGLLWMED